jgi:hypothetical protein
VTDRVLELAYLHGVSEYGDSIEDEWVIVYMLRELSKSFPNIWIRVFDTDGEFLLVEAARILPKWLSPEIDSNRVWIHEAKLKIIPLSPEGLSARPKNLSLEDAVTCIQSDPDELVYSPMIEAEAFYRLEKYPQQISNSAHHALATIPRKLAYILHAKPKAIAPALESFYIRNAVSLGPLNSPYSSLIFPPTDLVTVSVCFTKVLYAQLKSQRFNPPPAWQGLVGRAEIDAVGAGDEQQKTLERLVLGMRLTTGFEILARKVQEIKSRVAREVEVLLEDLEEDGDSVLPKDDEIQGWKDHDREDDDSWMDIDFKDLERELDGKQGQGAGFKDAAAQTDLRKLVSRFEAFLNDDEAGFEGAEVDEMDEDNDDDDGEWEDNDSDEDEDKEVSFDEEQFAQMMREMMGLPPETGAPRGDARPATKASKTTSGGEQDEDEDEEIRRLMTEMESELNQHGALTLDLTPKKLAALKGKATATKAAEDNNGSGSKQPIDADSESDGDEVDIDYNLAKNLLESFKTQAGLAGPAGNILGMMGMRLPRDDEDSEDEVKK